MIELEDFTGNKFTEGDTVIFASSQLSLRRAKVRGIKQINTGRFRIALGIIDGLDLRMKNYSRDYYPHDFYKVEE